MDRFFGADFAAAATTMVCVPDRLNPMWVRFSECEHITDYDQVQGICQCGHPLPEPLTGDGPAVVSKCWVQQSVCG